MPYEYTRETNICSSECTLIKKSIESDADGVAKGETISERTVFCNVSSIYMRDTMAAFQLGVKLQWKLTVFYGDYDGELTVRYDGVEYSVYRTYVTGDEIELYLRKDAGTWQAELT